MKPYGYHEAATDLRRLRRIARRALQELERLGATDNDNRLGKNKIYHALKRELERKP